MNIHKFFQSCFLNLTINDDKKSSSQKLFTTDIKARQLISVSKSRANIKKIALQIK